MATVSLVVGPEEPRLATRSLPLLNMCTQLPPCDLSLPELDDPDQDALSSSSNAQRKLTLCPSDVLVLGEGRQQIHLAMLCSTFWEVGRELRIEFINGNYSTHQCVEDIVTKEWGQYANIKFNFQSAATQSDIRISFNTAGINSSYVGTDALCVSAPHATMHLSIHDRCSAAEFKGTVLHEFGHALGCIHEHSSPKADIPWDTEKVYLYYKEKYQWEKDKVDENVLYKYDIDRVGQSNHTEFDKESIMMYSVPSCLIIEGGTEEWWVPPNLTLSERDKLFIRDKYPPSATPPLPAPPPIRILSLDGGILGASSLHVLVKLMRKVRLARGKRAEVRPCEVFDLICGTGTGGLVALMLGRLEMVFPYVTTLIQVCS